MTSIISGAAQPVYVIGGDLNTAIDTSTPLNVLLPNSQGWDHFVATSLNLIPGAFSVTLIGTNPGVANNATELVWQSGPTFDPPVNTSVITIVSDSSDDTFGTGIGAHYLAVDGLDGNRDFLSEFVPLDGTNPVTTQLNTFIRLNSAQTIISGSTEFNQGTITCMIDGKLVATIPPLTNQVREGVVSIPRNHTAVLLGTSLQALKNESLSLFVTARYSVTGGASFTKNRIGPSIDVYQTTSSLMYPTAIDINVPFSELIIEAKNITGSGSPIAATATVSISIFDNALV